MTLDLVLPIIGSALNIPLILVLTEKRLARALPILTFYFGLSACVAIIGCLVFLRFSRYFLDFWLANLLFDSIFYPLVLMEIGKNVHRYNRNRPYPRAVVLLLFAGAFLLVWSLGSWHVAPSLSFLWKVTLRAQQANAVLEVAALLTLVWWSSLQRLRWPDAELQIASGMAVYTLVAFAVAVLHSHGFLTPAFHWLDLLTPASCVAVLAYWVFYFSFKYQVPKDLRDFEAARPLAAEERQRSSNCAFGAPTSLPDRNSARI